MEIEKPLFQLIIHGEFGQWHFDQGSDQRHGAFLACQQDMNVPGSPVFVDAFHFKNVVIQQARDQQRDDLESLLHAIQLRVEVRDEGGLHDRLLPGVLYIYN